MKDPLDPNKRNPLAQGEFDSARGEQQRPGAKGLKAVPPDRGPIPVGIAPPEPLQVVSVFDTRPISAYDFVASSTALWTSGDAAQDILQSAVPVGYTAVLRRLRIEFTSNGAVNLSSATANVATLRLLRNGAPIPNNTLQLRGALDVLEWPTHQVFGANEFFGMQIAGSRETPVADVIVNVNFFGTLIPTKSKPPETEIASPAVLTRTLQDWKDEVLR